MVFPSGDHAGSHVGMFRWTATIVVVVPDATSMRANPKSHSSSQVQFASVATARLRPSGDHAMRLGKYGITGVVRCVRFVPSALMKCTPPFIANASFVPSGDHEIAEGQ